MSATVTSDAGRRRHRHPVRWLTTVLGLVVAGGLAVIIPRLGQDPSIQVAADSPLLGRPVPAFSLRDATGGAVVTSRQLDGHYAVVYFFATWCPVCVAEVPGLVSFYSHWHSRGIDLIGIGYQDSRVTEAQFARQDGISWPLLVDPGDQAALRFGIFGIPETFVIDPAGTVVAKLVGEVSASQLGAVLEHVMAEGGTVSVHGGAVVPTSPGTRSRGG
jgi:cytochrome c biogenesis protein CcmG/thiol:disulfide interchange protein DsbE